MDKWKEWKEGRDSGREWNGSERNNKILPNRAKVAAIASVIFPVEPPSQLSCRRFPARSVAGIESRATPERLARRRVT